MINLYVYSNYDSKGAIIRLLLNLFPSIFIIIFIRHFKFKTIEKNIWLSVSVINILLFLLFFIINGSAALDRISIYLTPIQIVAFTHMPEILSKKGYLNKFIIFNIVTIYALILFVWIKYSDNSENWLPYNNVLF